MLSSSLLAIRVAGTYPLKTDAEINADKDTQTVLQERTTDSVEWNYVLWRLIDADVTVIFTAPSAAAASRKSL